MTHHTRTPSKPRAPGQGTIRQLPSGNMRWEVMIEGRRFSGVTKTKKEAQNAITLKTADALRGGVVDPSTETLGDYLSRWLTSRASTRAIRTTAIQRRHLNKIIAPILGSKRLQKLTPSDLRRLYDHLNDEGLGASSQRQVHQFLVSSLGDAHRLELVTRNVAQLVRPTPARGREARELPAFTAEEAAKFVEVARQDPAGRWFIFALSTGMRRGEVCGLCWEDVSLSDATAQVTEVIAKSEGETYITTPKTQGSRRTVHLSPSAVQLLREQQAYLEVCRQALGGPVAGHPKGYTRKRPWAASGRVFPNSFGATMDPNNLRRTMQSLCERAGVRYVTIHGLRHTYASLSLMRGVPIEVVSKQLGHASVGFTMNQYRWVYKSERVAWALGIDDLTRAG
ncbi:site-specific integrase [Deinococcus sp. KSM4-11]|uniref:tyrosine-type recombinase/integrase n=1 Tax=Deinococcus sp. KSM4-11 TaxID=2568654 RepID=UPI0010A5966F|nr:site-specific integrase [Deinococcus sp. KSM4-11]THF88438.1 site-specific integrase [Deinococcus sp. KSM4-11]